MKCANWNIITCKNLICTVFKSQGSWALFLYKGSLRVRGRVGNPNQELDGQQLNSLLHFLTRGEMMKIICHSIEIKNEPKTGWGLLRFNVNIDISIKKVKHHAPKEMLDHSANWGSRICWMHFCRGIRTPTTHNVTCWPSVVNCNVLGPDPDG